MDIYDSLSGLQILFQIGNLSQWKLVERKNWKPQTSRVLVFYTILVMIVSTILLIYSFFSDTDFDETNNNKIGKRVDFVQMLGIRLSHLVLITESLLRAKEEMKFYASVREIDRIYECSLNIDVNNRQFRSFILQRGVLMLLIYLGSEIFMLITKIITSNSSFSIIWMLYMFPYLICGLRYFQIFNAISIIKNRLHKLSAVLEQINLFENVSTNVYDNSETIKFISKDLPIFDSIERIHRRIDMENPEMKRLLTTRDIYNRLWELNCIVNRCYGVSMLISVANDFIAITSNCYWIFLHLEEDSANVMDFLQTAAIAALSIPHLFNVLTLAIICEKTVKITTNIALGLHSIKVDLLNDNHHTCIEQFSMQLLHQKLAFTAAGFFDVDCTLLYTIVGATTTYLIILIQFHMSEHKTEATG